MRKTVIASLLGLVLSGPALAHSYGHTAQNGHSAQQNQQRPCVSRRSNDEQLMGGIAGAVIGGVIGGIKGNKKDQQINGGTLQKATLDKTTRYFDDQTQRYYYYEKGTSRTFYENGQLRSQN